MTGIRSHYFRLAVLILLAHATGALTLNIVVARNPSGPVLAARLAAIVVMGTVTALLVADVQKWARRADELSRDLQERAKSRDEWQSLYGKSIAARRELGDKIPALEAAASAAWVEGFDKGVERGRMSVLDQMGDSLSKLEALRLSGLPDDHPDRVDWRARVDAMTITLAAVSEGLGLPSFDGSEAAMAGIVDRLKDRSGDLDDEFREEWPGVNPVPPSAISPASVDPELSTYAVGWFVRKDKTGRATHGLVYFAADNLDEARGAAERIIRIRYPTSEYSGHACLVLKIGDSSSIETTARKFEQERSNDLVSAKAVHA